MMMIYQQVLMELRQYQSSYFAAFAIVVDAEGGIFFLEPIQGSREIGSFRASGFDGKRDDGFGDEHGSLIGRRQSLARSEDRSATAGSYH